MSSRDFIDRQRQKTFRGRCGFSSIPETTSGIAFPKNDGGCTVVLAGQRVSGKLKERLIQLLTDIHYGLYKPTQWEKLEAAYDRACHFARHGTEQQKKQAADTLLLVDYILLNIHGTEGGSHAKTDGT